MTSRGHINSRVTTLEIYLFIEETLRPRLGLYTLAKIILYNLTQNKTHRFVIALVFVTLLGDLRHRFGQL